MSNTNEKPVEIATSQKMAGNAEHISRVALAIEKLFPNGRIDRVLLVSPPDAHSSMFNYKTGKRGRYWNFPPYGLGIIATHLRNDGLATDILNLNHEILKACTTSLSQDDFDFNKVWTKKLIKKISIFQPDIIGVTCMFTQTHKSTVDVVNEIKFSYPKIPIVAGGVHITNSFLNDKTSDNLCKDLSSVDVLFVYESELAFKQFVKVVNKEALPNSLSQVYFNTNEDKKLFIGNNTFPQGEDLDVIPAHDLLNTSELSKYGTIGSFYCLKNKGTKFTTVLSNRGCRARCTFCSVRNFNGKSVRMRPIQRIVDELLMLRDKYGIGHIMWLDDDLFFNHKRAISLFDEMVKKNVGITWDCTNGVLAASCTDEVISAAAESGCIGLNIGMESGNPEILRQIKKPANVETLLNASALLKKYEQINSRVFLMIGFPGETYRMIYDTIDLSQQMNLDWYNVTILQPLPNTPIFDSMIEEGYFDEVDFDDIRYNSGVYGKHRKIAEAAGRDLLTSDFENAFHDVNLDDIPPAEELDAIWAYMNYHLNFNRLFEEDRPTKLQQQLKYVGNIRDLVAPENAFAMYFYGYLENKISGKVSRSSIELLENRLLDSPYWISKFDEFDLSLAHLKTGLFPDN